MLAIRIENKRESIMFAIALGCVIFFIIGVTWIYWSHHASRMPSDVESVSLAARSAPMDAAREISSGIGSHWQAKQSGSVNTNTSLWFFGTLIVLLLLLFGLTFRYYSYREVKQAERRWKTACESFVTRMEIERIASEERMEESKIAWSRILNGNRMQVSELVAHS